MMRQILSDSSHSFGSSLDNPMVNRLLEAARHFSELLERLGYSTNAYSESSLLQLTSTPTPKLAEIATSFETWSDWIEPLDPTQSYDNEIRLLVRALDKFGFEINDEFLKTIEKNQIIEFYNEDMIQLYRSFNFFKISGYSALDISLNEWYVLWDRPKSVLESIANELNEALNDFIPVKHFTTKKHVVREIFNASRSEHFVPRTSLLTPVRLGSLKPKRFGSHQKKGFICTSTGEVVAVGKESQKIQFI